MRKKNYKLSKFFLNQSPVYLSAWLENKRNKYEPKEKRKAIEKLIPKKMEDVYLFREQILSQNSLHRLAVTRLYNKGLAKKLIINGLVKFNYDANEIVSEMIEIVQEADNKQSRSDLENYIKWGLL